MGCKVNISNKSRNTSFFQMKGGITHGNVWSSYRHRSHRQLFLPVTDSGRGHRRRRVSGLEKEERDGIVKLCDLNCCGIPSVLSLSKDCPQEPDLMRVIGREKMAFYPRF